MKIRVLCALLFAATTLSAQVQISNGGQISLQGGSGGSSFAGCSSLNSSGIQCSGAFAGQSAQFGTAITGNQFTMINLSTIPANWTLDVTSPTTALQSLIPGATVSGSGTSQAVGLAGYVNAISGYKVNGSLLSFTNLAGSVAAAQLPAPTGSTLGGVESITCGSSQHINAISTSGVPGCTADASAAVISAIQNGVHGDGSTIDGANIAALMSANPNALIYFPATSAYYLLDNSGGTGSAGLTIPTAFHGTILAAPGARFLCNTATSSAGQCVLFNGNSNIHVYGLVVGYTSEGGLPLARNACSPDNAILVEASSYIDFHDTKIEASPGVGIWNTGSSHIKYFNTNISTTSADGIHFENVADFDAESTVVNNSGDDMIAATQTTGGTNNGGVIHSANLTGGHARGVAIVGPSNIVVDDVVVNSSAYDCLAVVTQSGYNTSSHIALSNAICSGMGTVTAGAGTSGVMHGLEVDGTSYVTASNLDITGSGSSSDGVYIYNSAQHVTISNATSTNAGNVGFAVNSASYVHLSGAISNTSASHGYSLQSCSYCEFTDLKSDHDGYYGVYTSGLNSATFNGVVIRDGAGTNGGLVWEYESAAGPASVSNLRIVDDKATATGYKAGGSSNGSYPIVYSNLSAAITNGSFGFNIGGTGEQWGPRLISSVASGATIALQSGIANVSGTSAISTITAPAAFGSAFGDCYMLVAGGAWSTTTSGNIANAITATSGNAYQACYNGTKFYIK